MVVIPIPIYPVYIKKEDAKDFAKRQRWMIPFVLLAMVFVMGLMQFVVYPKLVNLYKVAHEPIPSITQTFPYGLGVLTIVFIIVSVYFLSTSPNYEKLNQILSKYKDGEMIKAREILEGKYSLIFFFIAGITLGYIVLSLIVPIYNLTATIK